jgi:hypothetical protein
MRYQMNEVPIKCDPGDRAVYITPVDMNEELDSANVAYEQIYRHDRRYLFLRESDYHIIKMWIDSRFADLTLREFICKLCM